MLETVIPALKKNYTLCLKLLFLHLSWIQNTRHGVAATCMQHFGANVLDPLGHKRGIARWSLAAQPLANLAVLERIPADQRKSCSSVLVRKHVS